MAVIFIFVYTGLEVVACEEDLLVFASSFVTAPSSATSLDRSNGISRRDDVETSFVFTMSTNSESTDTLLD